jgi:hypothetical protein
MEETALHRGSWVSIFSLMRDGAELAETLRTTAIQQDSQEDCLKSVIDPYIQVVDGNARCVHTGLRLIDIWRYFRYTWSSAYQSVPGRRMQLLIRDRAADGHPVIGIAALSSSVVQSKVRDKWIGWHGESLLEQLQRGATQKDAKYLLTLLGEAIDDIYCQDFLDEGLIKSSDLKRPDKSVCERLAAAATAARTAHERYPKQTDYKASTINPDGTDWTKQARSFLFRSKRASSLATLLATKRTLIEFGMERPTKKGLNAVLAHERGRKALSTVIRSMKAKHVGIDMLDITVCGAVPPYAELLGGKLVSLLMLSPAIVRAYEERYSGAVSIIASAMKGAPVTRKPQLVLLGTTSLYGVASSQYNRLRIPKDVLGSNADLSFELLGKTRGYGSYHFSQQTLKSAEVVASQGREGRRVNSIFGEGVSPKLRKLREALDVAGFPADGLLRHGSRRLIYGVPLAKNFRAVLCSREKRPRYFFRVKSTEAGTDLISRFWRKRWLEARVQRAETLESIARHRLVRPVTHGARVASAVESEALPLFAAGD